ncbi:MAG: YybH family protein [Xanthobacteraceae bacterium]
MAALGSRDGREIVLALDALRCLDRDGEGAISCNRNDATGRIRSMRSTMTDDERAIRELVDVWLAASKAGDLQTVLSLMTDDVVFMVPGRRPFGKEAFAAASQGMQNVSMEGTSVIHELQVLGDWAYLRNYIEMVVTPPNGAPVRRSGYTLTILRKESDGRWRLARDANLMTQAT